MSAPSHVAGSSPDQVLPATHNAVSSQGEGEQTTTARPEADQGGSPPVGQLDLALESGEPAGGAGRVGVVPAPPATTALVFTVWGTPIPQGSHKGFVVNGRAVITQDNKRTRPWRQDIIAAAIAGLGERPQMTGPVEVRVQFVMPRPKGHYGTGRNINRLRDGAPVYPAGKPDVDKLARSLLDALTAAAVVRDDAQVVHLCAHKVYADCGDRAGAHVYVAVATS